MKIENIQAFYRIGLLLVVSLFVGSKLWAQTDSAEVKPIYFEKLTDGTTQFYFDEHYFLVDKFCQFKSIERVGKYDLSIKSFDGPFTDYNNDGKVILTGNYAQGKKEGIFTAYFANGQVKWITTFKNGKAEGISRYNYPDGLPMLEILYNEEGAFVQNYWDTRRRQRVIEGNGKYEFSVRAEGYNEYGYTFQNYQGNIKSGKPDGNWNIFLVYPKNERDYAGYERFEEGLFKGGYDEITSIPYKNSSRIQIGPSLYFLQAEEMVSKNCTIDENQDFSMYVMKKLESAFAIYDSRGLLSEPSKLKITVSVNKMGSLRDLEIVEGLSEKDGDKIIANALQNIAYWIPSYAGTDYIDDVLTITVDVTVDEENGQLRFYNLQIARENGI
ncbi:toxin-antitoxin system YwqK family antitoxin [Olivibacter sp. XZL3]|uniref:toxin-antitoxin system YwqK family antitoxin n=1 Tax=Olivibacter sp. XZL3 TaxID=1735116 RepID=UPI0010666440|nr:hypothetical protein [Olivibacter sp. XZL3]